jgi:transcription initiation factor TFIIIB Brf1 subunit/transcription initiation factor TFIIB
LEEGKMSELLGCPFCGGEVKIIPEGDYHEIVCDDCHLTMWWHTWEELETAWNNREGDKHD